MIEIRCHCMASVVWLICAAGFAQEAIRSGPEFAPESPLNRGLDANLYVQTSAEYRAACYQAFNLAKLRLDSIKPTVAGQRPPAIVLDLDETVLDNRGFQSWILRTNRLFDLRLFKAWERGGGDAVRLVPGAKEFIQYAGSKGVELFYISNRSEEYKTQTMATMSRLGIAAKDADHVLLATDTSSKAPRREQVEAMGYQIVLNIGDNLRDFHEQFRTPDLSDSASAEELDAAIELRKDRVDQTDAQWGEKWIILPNPVYGEWTKALGRGSIDGERLEPGTLAMQVAFWNVENLFDLDDDPNVEGDEEFTAAGPKQWSESRLDTKLTNLAVVISRMNDGLGPQILGLAEIENAKVIEMLVERLKPLGRDYQIVHQDSPSDRGIDCGLIYDANELDLVSKRFHFVDADKTRDIVEATFARDGQTLTCFVNHWPSRGNPEWQRLAAATVLRGRIDQLLDSNPQANIVSMGDYNDHPEDKSLRDVLRAVGSLDQMQSDTLFNSSFAAVPDDTSGSYVYNDRWEILDQLILSPGMLLPGGVNWGIGSTRNALLVDDQLYDPRGPAPPRPSRSFTRDMFHSNGYSDHLPVTCRVYWSR